MDVYTFGIIVLKYFKANPHPPSTNLTSTIQLMDFSLILKAPKALFQPLKPSIMLTLMNKCILFWLEAPLIRLSLLRLSTTNSYWLLMPMEDSNYGTLIQPKNLKLIDGDILVLKPILMNPLGKLYAFAGTKVSS